MTTTGRSEPGLRRPALRAAAALLLASALAIGPAAADEATAVEPAPPATAPAKKANTTALLDRLARHAVSVSVRFQKDLEAEVRGVVPPNPRSVTERYRQWRMSRRVPGFLVRDRRTVLVSDLWVPPGAVASIAVKPLNGPEVGARLRGFLRRATGIVLETDADVAAEPVPFPERMSVTIETPLELGALEEGPDGLELWLEGLGGTKRRPVGRAGFAYGHPEGATQGLDGLGEDAGRTVDLVMDERGTPLGFRFGGTVDLGNDVWMGPDVLEDREVPFTRLRTQADAWRETSSLHRVKVLFRTASRHDRQRNPFSAEEATADAEFWGPAVGEDTILALGRLTDEQIRRIEGVRLQDDDAHGKDARFAGRVRGYDAFVVRISGESLRPLPAEAPPPPAIGEAFLVHQVGWRGGSRRDQVDYNRVVGWGRGYGDRRFLATEREVQEGALLATLDGAVFGVAVRLNPEDREKPLTEGRGRGERDNPFPTVAVVFSEGVLPARLAEDPDTSLMPQEETAAKRTPWLGVEYDAIDRGVAELMAVSEPTYDGARGLIVTTVYPGSPAAKVGIEEGDIVLSVRKTSGPGSDAPPVDLRDRDEPMFGGFPFSMDDAAPAPWRPRANALVRLLQSWGVGTKCEIEVLHDGKVAKHAIEVELGPPDFSSAPRAKDEGTGLSVRDLTYEVKAAIRMSPDATGAVVARVEPGSAAAQARINENEIILEYAGRSVPDAKTLKEWIDADRSGGKRQARLVVRRLGKTRIVDVSLAAPERDEATKPSGEDGDGTDGEDGDGKDGEGEEDMPPDGEER